MTDAWDDMRKAKEDSYFEKKNREALERMAKKKDEKPKISPVSGQPMVKTVVHNIVVDQCPASGGIWLEAAEIDRLFDDSRKHASAAQHDYLAEFFRGLKGLVEPGEK